MKYVVAALWCVLALSCDRSSAPPAEDPGEVRPRSEPIEFVGLSVELPIENADQIGHWLAPLFGSEAERGQFMEDRELQTGLFLSSIADSRTPEQAVVELQMEPVGATERRTIVRVPVSFAYGRVFIRTAEVAVSRTLELLEEDPEDVESFNLEYKSTSYKGGVLTVAVEHRRETQQTVLRLETSSPQTSLQPGQVNQQALEGQAHEVLGGTVWFELTRDQFDFFSTRAYGITAGADQNFDDFMLLPHDWLRLTVTPQLEDEMVDVAFEVVDLDGERVPFARAPASVVAGDQFRANVFRMVENMLWAERQTPGSSTRFVVPFHYDDPEGGGVVNVIAQGSGGRFRIAYSVASPIKRLQDVEFLPFQGLVDLPDPSDTIPTVTECADLGSTDAIEGRLKIRFDASPTVRESDNLTDPLVGNVYGSVFRAQDVTLAGPNDGAEAVASFAFENVDITTPGEGEEYVVDALLPRGEYQVLGFIDIDGNGAETRDPDEGDPVTLPIGGYEIKCSEQPVVVEFALLLPPGR